ncbi:peptide deformylase, partial [Candidatus Hodgkinia cicadicola]
SNLSKIESWTIDRYRLLVHQRLPIVLTGGISRISEEFDGIVIKALIGNDLNKSVTWWSSQLLLPNVLRYPAPPIRIIKNNPSTLSIHCIHRLMHLTFTNSALGISSNQMGWPYGIFIINLPTISWKRKLHVLAYPSVVFGSEYREDFKECCLSVANEYSISRKKKMIVVCYDVLRDVVCVIKSYSVFTACLQHECDHNMGYIISDKHETS